MSDQTALESSGLRANVILGFFRVHRRFPERLPVSSLLGVEVCIELSLAPRGSGRQLTVSGPALVSSLMQRQRTTKFASGLLAEAGADRGADRSLDMGPRGPDLVRTGGRLPPLQTGRGGSALHLIRCNRAEGASLSPPDKKERKMAREFMPPAD